MPQNNLREIKKTIYKLKRNYGQPMTVVKPDDSNTNIDYTTGKVTRSYNQVIIRRGILLPANRKRTFIYDLAYIAANSNFTYGGYFDKNEREIIIENKDLDGLAIDTSTHIITGGKRFEVTDFALFEDNSCTVIKARGIGTAEDILIPANLLTTTSVTASIFTPTVTAAGTATWIFGDGNEESSNTPSNTYAAAGEKTVYIRDILLSSITDIDWSSQDLTSVKLKELSALATVDLNTNSLVYVNLSGTIVTTVDLSSNSLLENVKIDNSPLLTTLEVRSCALTTENLNSILGFLDGFGLSGGTFDWTSNSNSPSGTDAQGFYTNLVGKSWTLLGTAP